MLLNCDAGEDSSEFIWQQGDQASQSQRKSTPIIHWKEDAEAPIVWPSDVKSQLTGKDSEAGKDLQKEKGVTED